MGEISEIIFKLIKDKKTRKIGLGILILLIILGGGSLYYNNQNNNSGNIVNNQGTTFINSSVNIIQIVGSEKKEELPKQDIEILSFNQVTINPPFYYVGQDAYVIYDIKDNIKVPYNVTTYWISPDSTNSICYNVRVVNNPPRDIDKYYEKCSSISLNKVGNWIVSLIVGYKDLHGNPKFTPERTTTVRILKKLP